MRAGGMRAVTRGFGAPLSLRLRVAVALALGLVAGLLSAPIASAAIVTAAADPARTAWYPGQPSLTPALVSGGTFGQLFDAPLQGQIYAQPLVANGVVLVATEDDRVYGLDPETGTVRWSRSVGTPWRSSDLGCGDLSPRVGVTGTPVIDTDAAGGHGAAYFAAKTYAAGNAGPAQWDLHGVDLQTGEELPGWPVRLEGVAQNDGRARFDPTHQLNRPALLLMDGVVYVAFAAHCDVRPYRGWVMGVDTTGEPRLVARWAAVGGDRDGAGIWQSGGGLVSDGPGRIFLTTGNGGTPAVDAPAAPGTMPPGDLGHAVVRLDVQSDGSLRAGDFFMPYNAAELDGWDADLGSGAPVALPRVFGSPAAPDLLMQVGKQGRIYLLDRSALGGFRNGAAGGDAVVAAINGNEGVWARPAVWPGDGGRLWFPTASSAPSGGGSAGRLTVYAPALVDGVPTLRRIARSSDPWLFGSSGAVITSDGEAAGSGVAWLVRAAGGGRSQLVAYPAAAQGDLRPIWFSAPFRGTKFNPPGIAPGGRVYVGTADGHLLGFGAPTGAPLASPGVTFAFAQTVGTASAPVAARLTASRRVEVRAVRATTSEFAPAPVGLPAVLDAGEHLDVPIVFTPGDTGPRAGALVVETDAGPFEFPLAGTGRPADAHLSVGRTLIDFGGVPVGGSASERVTITNDGGSPLTLARVEFDADPAFLVTGLPDAGAVLAPGEARTVAVEFRPVAPGTARGSLRVDAGAAGSAEVGLSGTSAAAGRLVVSREALDAGAVPVGQERVVGVDLVNAGGSSVTITESKPPVRGAFAAPSELPEGTVVAPGARIPLEVAFAPAALGAATDTWTITADDGAGARLIALRGEGVIPDPAAGGWQRNGDAVIDGAELALTPDMPQRAGTAFWPAPVPSRGLRVRFHASIGPGTGGDGLALVLADARAVGPTALGAPGGGLGYSGIAGLAVALDTSRNVGDPADRFVGIADGVSPEGPDRLRWRASGLADVPLRDATHEVDVRVGAGGVDVSVDGVPAVHSDVLPAPEVLVGFSAGTGDLTDRHAVADVRVTAEDGSGAGAAGSGGGEGRP